MKFNSSGARLWATYYGGSDDREESYSICTDNSNNLYISGWTESTNFPTQTLTGAYNQTTHGGDSSDVFIVKFNSSGARIWATYYGGSSKDGAFDNYRFGEIICTDSSGNLYITGETESTNFPTQTLPGAYNQTTLAGYRNAFILKFNSNCARIWATYYGGSYGEEGKGICTDNSNNLYVTGYTTGDFPTQTLSGAYNQTTYGGSADAFILKFSPTPIGIKNTSNEIPTKYSLQQNYPNPFNPSTNIKFNIKKTSVTKLIIYDALGREINTLVNEKLGAGSYEVDWNASGYPSGVYFYKLVSEEYVDVKKMLLVK